MQRPIASSLREREKRGEREEEGGGGVQEGMNNEWCRTEAINAENEATRTPSLLKGEGSWAGGHVLVCVTPMCVG